MTAPRRRATTAAALLSLVSLATVAGTTSATAAAPSPAEVTLTAAQVSSAGDIMAAIDAATAGGTRWGTVTLDGSGGPFTYAGPGRSIDIQVSRVILRGIHGAAITNCDDGVFFRGVADDVVVEDISFTCTGFQGFGVREFLGAHQRVFLIGNRFEAGTGGNGGGIAIDRADGWLIQGNTFVAPADHTAPAISIAGAVGTTIAGNVVSADSGIRVSGADGVSIVGNRLSVAASGISVSGQGHASRIIANRIEGLRGTGIAVDGESGLGHPVLANRIACAPGATCVPVSAAPGTIVEAGTLAPPAAPNLIPNGGIEADPAAAFYTTAVGPATFAWATDAWHSPTHALSITAPPYDAAGRARASASGAMARWLTRIRTIPVAPGTHVDLTGWLRADGHARGALAVTFWTAGETYVPASAVTSGETPPTAPGGTGTWQQLGLRATVPSGAAFARVEVRLLSDGRLLADDLSLTAG